MTKPTRFDITLDPFDLAKKGQTFHGCVRTKDLTRIADLLCEDTELDAQLRFGVDQMGVRVVEGDVMGDVSLQCQRCLEPYQHALDMHFKLAIVASEEMIARLPEDYDPLLVEDGEVFLRDIIEDEIILALPSTSTHSEEECAAEATGQAVEEEASTEDEPRQNPFKGLADLLKKDQS